MRFTTAPRHPPFRRMGGACVTLLLLAFPLVLAASPDHDCGSVHNFFDRLQRELAHAEKLLEHCGLAFPERSLPAAVDSSAHLHDEIRRLQGTIDRLRAQLRELEHGKRSSTTPLLTGRRLMSTASPAGAKCDRTLHSLHVLSSSLDGRAKMSCGARCTPKCSPDLT